MRIPRFYIAETLQTGATLNLPRDKAHHLVQVLKVKAGDAITLFNNSGDEFAATVQTCSRKTVRIEINQKNQVDRESPFKITLAVAVVRAKALDYALQKAVELGVDRVVPLYTEYSPVRLIGADQQKKLQHWQNIIISASEQCGRSRLAELTEPVVYSDWVGSDNIHTGIILQPGGEISLEQVHVKSDRLILMVGPVGGFSAVELGLASDQGYIPVSLGPRILRVDTAVISAMSIAQQCWGDLRRRSI